MDSDAEVPRHHDQEAREGRLKDWQFVIDCPHLQLERDGNGKHKKNGKGEKDDDLSGRERARGGQALRGSVADLARGADAGGVGSVFEGPVEKEGGAAMRERGSGSVFDKPGSRFKWISYSFRGKAYQESSKSTDERVARKLLRQRLSQVTKDDFIDPAKSAKWILTDMLEVIRQDYEREQKRSFECVKDAFKHLINDTFEHQGVQRSFEFYRVLDYHGGRDRRVRQRKAQGWSRQGIDQLRIGLSAPWFQPDGRDRQENDSSVRGAQDQNAGGHQRARGFLDDTGLRSGRGPGGRSRYAGHHLLSLRECVAEQRGQNTGVVEGRSQRLGDPAGAKKLQEQKAANACLGG